MNNNSIMVVYPYLHKGTWVFDDEDKGLQREPFIAGIDGMLSNVVDMQNLDENGFALHFSSSFMPNAHMTLDWIRSEGGGNWYRCNELGMDGWLCPALYKYFTEAPKKIWTIFQNKIK
jgi:hypothetical protein